MPRPAASRSCMDFWTRLTFGQQCKEKLVSMRQAVVHGPFIVKILRVITSFATPTFITLAEPLILLTYNKGKFKNTISSNYFTLSWSLYFHGLVNGKYLFFLNSYV